MSIPDIVDNDEFQLFDVLNELLEAGLPADFASGFFNIGGYALVRERLNGIPQFRLLLGREPATSGLPTRTGRPTQLIDLDIDSVIQKDLAAEDLTETNKTVVEDLLEFLSRDSVQVRLYTQSFFHGKAYIFQDTVIVGSSNFTRAGLTRNSELNAVQKSTIIANAYREWFERFWQQADDYKESLIELLRKSKHGDYPWEPYWVYIKALYEYFRDDLDTEGMELFTSSKVELTEFQEEGHVKALKIMDKYGGVMISDSVGLGKTYIGKRILEHYAYYQRKRAMVICPAQLRDMWVSELYDANIQANVQSQEALGQKDFPVDHYQDVEVVLIDESHNFRNTITTRYKNLERILGGGPRKKLVLMTATPINNNLLDLYHQVNLITRGDDYHFRPAGIGNLKTYFVKAQKGLANLFNLLEEVVIRRTRHYVKENYPEATINGKRIKFPDRTLHTVRYDLEATYEHIYDDIVNLIDQLHLTPYNLERYKIEKSKQDEEDDMRNQALIGLIKTLFLKRFESSVHAFRISIGRQLGFQKAFLEQLGAGRLLDSAEYRKTLLFEEDDQEDLEAILAQLPPIDMTDYDIQRVETDIDSDLELLEQIHIAVSPIEEAEDDKLQHLVSLLEDDLAKKKVLVFSYFKDTARYVYRYLRETKDTGASLEGRSIRIIDSDVPADQRRPLIERFAPRANQRDDLAGTEKEIDILVSTDVLSEGQNLQDGDTMLNYDLHWNPTRMIQRAGRIDRLGTPFDILNIYNFFPEKGLEKLLKLVKKLQHKLTQINDTIGLDSSVMGEVADPKTFNTLDRIAAEDHAIIDELEAFGELAGNELMKQQLAQFLKAYSASQIDSIPFGIHSGKARGDIGAGVFFYFRAEDNHFWRFFDVGYNRILENRLDIFKRIYCKPDTPRVEADMDIYQLIEKIKNAISEDTKAQRAATMAPKKLNKVQSDLIAILREGVSKRKVAKASAYGVIKILNLPMTSAFVKDLKAVRDLFKETMDYVELDRALKAFGEQFEANGEDKEEEGPETRSFSPEDLELVCYMTLS
ncbi:MAG: helicase [Deltaproteobacteria bacterium]|nr:helicase [Deltaproteobacteria bacterium]